VGEYTTSSELKSELGLGAVEPSAGIADTQSVKTAGNATEVGFDGGKQIFGHKRHIGRRYLEITGCAVHGARRSDQAGNKIAFAVDG